MAVREILRQFCARGYEVGICGATIFDNERGWRRIEHELDNIRAKQGQVISVGDTPLLHYLYVTEHHQRQRMTSAEENDWMSFYTSTLDSLKPDLVFFYGGQALDMMIADEAKNRGIPVAAYVGNSSYKGHRWHRDVDLILTDSEATAQLYAEREGYDVTAVGTFIEPSSVIAHEQTREKVLFINPSIEKGAAFVAQIAIELANRRPDIRFEIVESRGSWNDIVKSVSKALGTPCETLPNVDVIPNTHDMRPVYQRARLLLAPSFCWESAGRVIAEAMLNGIPAMVSNRGGPPEVMGEGGIKINFPEECYEPPYTNIPSGELVERVVELIIRFYDDEEFYRAYSARALAAGQQRHNISANMNRVETAFAPLLARGAARPGALEDRRQGREPVRPVKSAAPQISVILPVGEREAFLREAIQSILVQDFTDYELLIVTDGVSPSVMSIVKSFADPRVRIIKLPIAGGISAARNAGIAAAKAPLIALMDSDDVALPSRLRTQHAFMMANPDVTVCSSNAIKLLPDGTRGPMAYPLTDGQIKARLIIVDSSVLNPTAMFRRDFIVEHGILYDPSFRIDEDHRFYADMIIAGAKFQGLPEALLLYRRHHLNTTNNRDKADYFKNRVRMGIFPFYFPRLNGNEMRHLADAMSIDQPVNINTGKSLYALDKALKEKNIYFGEDREEIQRILAAYRARLS